MKFTTTVILALILLSFNTLAQKKASPKKTKKISLKAEYWEYPPQSVQFLDYKNREAMKILTSRGKVILKDLSFTNGTIEYDMEPIDQFFATSYFRWDSENENECFYFRTARAGDPYAVDAIQYAPQIGGINLWDMLFHFQSNATFKKDDWNHVKLVISGKQMRAYVNDMDTPALEVGHLEGNVTTGTLGFQGQMVISNLTVKPDVFGDLSQKPGIDPTSNDPRYLRKWQVSTPIATADGIDFDNKYYPDSTTNWEPITAERRGLINLTRKFGKAENRRIVWLKTTITATQAKETQLNLGFSDEVWVFVNGRFLHVDKNLYGGPVMKQPDGRCSIENTSIKIPLAEGGNDLLIGIANSFYGWGVVARLNSLTGLAIEN